MIELIKAVILGIVQGVTEFLPISSSGHLVIGAELLQFQEQSIAFDVFLHLGTLTSVILVFRSEIFDMILAPFLYLKGNRSVEIMGNLRWILYIIIATVPAVFAGLFLKDSIEDIFSNLLIVYTMLFCTGIIMIVTRFLPLKDGKITGGNSFLIGCAQAMAILPGLSRSGSTIFTGMILGVDRQVAARFSFIMSIPAILGAVTLQLGNLLNSPPSHSAITSIVLGTVAAAVSGYFAIVLLLDFVKKNRLQWFGYYCILLSLTGVVFHFSG